MQYSIFNDQVHLIVFGGEKAAEIILTIGQADILP